MKHYDVVAAVVLVDDRILCVQKGKTRYTYTSYKFEFPGGKVEPGESQQEALSREIREELGYSIIVGEKIISIHHDYPDFSITMTAFKCTAQDTELTLTEHVTARWLTVNELDCLNWAAADIPVVEAVKKINNLCNL